MYQDAKASDGHPQVSSEELPEAGAASIQSTSDGSLAKRMAATNAYHLASSCSRLNAGALAAERAADAFSAAACRAAAMQRLPGHADVIGRPLRLPGERGSGLSRHLAGIYAAAGMIFFRIFSRITVCDNVG